MKILLLVISLFLLIFIPVFAGPNVGDPCPNFTLPDTTYTNHSLTDYQGMVVYMELGESWCGGCQSEYQVMTQLQAHYDSAGAPVQVLVVDIFESMSTTKSIQRNYGIVPPCLNDQSGTVWYAYHWDNYIPSNFIIQRDADQTLFYRAHTMSLSQMEYWIDQALAVDVEESPEVGVETSLKTVPLFNRYIKIEYSLQENMDTDLTIYDITGRTVAHLVDGYRSAGNHTLSWSSKKSGIYFIRLSAGNKVLLNKIIVLH